MGHMVVTIVSRDLEPYYDKTWSFREHRYGVLVDVKKWSRSHMA